MLCLGVIGLARAVFLKQLASLVSLILQPVALSKKCSWLEEDGEEGGHRGNYGLLASNVDSFYNYKLF